MPTGENATVLEEVQVDGQGFIFVPYAGRIRAAGNPPEAVRRVITEQLQEQTPDPQVQVSRLAGDGATVSVAGAVGAQGVYPIERPTRTLSAMLAAAGGLTIEPEIAQITIVRGGQQDTVWFQDLYEHPANDIALRGGDRIVVEEDTRSFTALGATLTQSRVPFESQTISAVEAIAQVGGLSSLFADPTGVFVFRNEPEAIARQLVGDPNLIGDQRVIYVLDLTRPNGVFLARDFAIRDGDTVYVTEAPYTQFAKVLSALTVRSSPSTPRPRPSAASDPMARPAIPPPAPPRVSPAAVRRPVTRPRRDTPLSRPYLARATPPRRAPPTGSPPRATACLPAHTRSPGLRRAHRRTGSPRRAAPAPHVPNLRLQTSRGGGRRPGGQRPPSFAACHR